MIAVTTSLARVHLLCGRCWAAGGLSNPEIDTRLFLSPRSVQDHLGKIFTKLDITSRAQLSRALSGS